MGAACTVHPVNEWGDRKQRAASSLPSSTYGASLEAVLNRRSEKERKKGSVGFNVFCWKSRQGTEPPLFFASVGPGAVNPDACESGSVHNRTGGS